MTEDCRAVNGIADAEHTWEERTKEPRARWYDPGVDEVAIARTSPEQVGMERADGLAIDL